MLSEEEIGEIKEHLNSAQNPIFYYDNDADGLCSFILLRKYIGRGKGVAVRSFPDLNGSYARKARELSADYVFVLDKPSISEEFIKEIDSLGLPIVWIDHHDVESEDFSSKFQNIFTYNPAKGKGESTEPVTFMSYQITNKKEDMWIAIIGCIADHYLPSFSEEFSNKYPEFWKDTVKEPFEAYFGTEIGKIAQALNFGLKDSISNVVRLQNFLISINSPAQVFEETGANFHFRKKYQDVYKKYEQLINKARDCLEENVLFFEYGGEISMSADLSNELSYHYPGKYIAVSYVKGNIANLSLRGKGIKQILQRILKKIEGSGGGHEDAVGARVNSKDLQKFKSLLKQEIRDDNN